MLLCGDGVTHHHRAERAGDGNRLSTGSDGFVGPGLIDRRADLLLHPHPGTARAAAEGLLAMTRHLGERSSRVTDQCAWWCDDVVVSTEVARIVVGHGASHGLDGRDLAGVDE